MDQPLELTEDSSVSPATATPETRLETDLRFWRQEVDRLTSMPEPLAPAVRDMLCAVLLSLAVDPHSDHELRRDVRRMLEAVEAVEVPTLDSHVRELRRENEKLRGLLAHTRTETPDRMAAGIVSTLEQERELYSA
jgi:hypothetical protein